MNECSVKELQVLFHSLQARQRMINHLQLHCALRTAHLRPPERNLTLHCHDFSAQNANQTFACGGYLDITVVNALISANLTTFYYHIGPPILLYQTWDKTATPVSAVHDRVRWWNARFLFPVSYDTPHTNMFFYPNTRLEVVHVVLKEQRPMSPPVSRQNNCPTSLLYRVRSSGISVMGVDAGSTNSRPGGRCCSHCGFRTGDDNKDCE